MDIRITDYPGDFEARRDNARLLALNEQVNDALRGSTQVLQALKGEVITKGMWEKMEVNIQGFVERAERLQAELECRLMPARGRKNAR